MPETAHAGAHAHKVLGDMPLLIAPTEASAENQVTATTFLPVVQTMVDQVSSARFMAGDSP